MYYNIETSFAQNGSFIVCIHLKRISFRNKLHGEKSSMKKTLVGSNKLLLLSVQHNPNDLGSMVLGNDDSKQQWAMLIGI
jgi:hypothetical protein